MERKYLEMGYLESDIIMILKYLEYHPKIYGKSRQKGTQNEWIQ